MTTDEIVNIIEEAYRLRYKNEFGRARALLEPLLRLEPPPAIVLLLMADCLRLSEDAELSEIEKLLRQGVALSPDSADAHLELAHFLYTWRDDAEQARALLSRARKLIAQSSISADLLEAGLLEDEGNEQDAISLLTRSADRFPESKRVREMLSRLRSS